MRLTTSVFILIFITFVTCVGCSSNSELLTENEIAISEQLKSKFYAQNQLIYDTDTLLAQSEVLTYYKNNSYTPIWIDEQNLNEAGLHFYGIIENAFVDGLFPEMFHFNRIKLYKDSTLLDTEMLLSNAFFLYATHLNLGCIDSATYQYTWKKDSLEFDLFEQLNRIKSGEKVADILYEHEPKIWDYQQLKTGLNLFLSKYQLDTIQISIPDIKEDSAACYNAAKTALLTHQYIDSATFKNDSLFIESLKKFQLQHGLKSDAVVGKWTGRALEKSNLERFYQAALSLEKWRWKKEQPDRYIRVNIPEFHLYLVDQKKVKRKHRVVVGAYATQTPEFTAQMKRMVTNPFWHVPYSISSTEILYGARKDSTYIRSKGYKLFKKGEEVDPSTVDWSSIRQTNFPYRVRQDGGSGNSLGKIKFLFPNIYSVFVHDTPSKRLFANDVRAYSHGCVRLEHPFDLAKALIELDEYDLENDSLDSIIVRGEQRVLELIHPFDVQIEYFTATGDSTGMIIFHPDIYGRDEKFISNAYSKFSPSSYE